jgi:hypothetical protein
MRIRVPGLAVIILATSFGPAATTGHAQNAASGPNPAAKSAAAAKSAPVAKRVPRTPWGHPDLQGTWDYRTITPLERPQQFGDREFLTDTEVKELEERARKRMDEAPAEDAPASTVHPTYWTDPGRFVADNRRTSLIVDPPNGRIPPLVNGRAGGAGAGRGGGGGRGAGGRPGGRADSWLDRSLLERCITWGLPTASLPGLYNNNIQIVQTPDHVVIVHEMVHDARVIPLDGRPRVTGNMRQYLGESRARFEGDTLVVETANFGTKTNYRGANANLKLTERYTRIDEESVDLRLTVEDPTTWTAPWTVALRLRPSEGELVEYACHEGNYGLRNMLEVARDEEKAAAAKAPGANK